MTDLVVVGTRANGNGRWCQSDLAGNVAEWTLDSEASYATPCADCANLSDGATRVVRGGSFTNASAQLRTSTRNVVFNDVGAHFYLFGARCARPAP